MIKQKECHKQKDSHKQKVLKYHYLLRYVDNTPSRNTIFFGIDIGSTLS